MFPTLFSSVRDSLNFQVAQANYFVNQKLSSMVANVFLSVWYKIKNIMKLEVRKPSLHHRGKYVATLEIRGKLLISHNENNKHVC